MAPDALPPLADDRRLLSDAAREAGQLALSYFRKSLEIREKPGDAGPVTEADLAVNALLSERLRNARPGYGWLSEENDDDKARLAAERVFIVDPIDGTRAFIDGAQGFCIAVAVVERGQVIAAAADLPARSEHYTAGLGQGADKDGVRLALDPLEIPEIGDAKVLTSRKFMEAEHWPGGVPPLERHFRSSLIWRHCLVAEGRFDAMVTFRDAHEWDVAAGALIAHEAGVTLTDGHGGPLVFNTDQAHCKGVVAAPEPLHSRIMTHRLAGP